MFRPVCGENQQYVLKGGGEYKFLDRDFKMLLAVTPTYYSDAAYTA